MAHARGAVALVLLVASAGAANAANCVSPPTNKGWLDGIYSTGGLHPPHDNTFGPGGLHGVPSTLGTSDTYLKLEVMDMANNPVTQYYPGTQYKIKLSTTNTESFAFLLTVENSTFGGTADKHVGTFSWTGNTMQNYNTNSAVRSTSNLAVLYELTWTSPAALTYETLHVRATFVQAPVGVDTTCVGKFKEVSLTSSVTCADSMKDAKEPCDDGNTNNNDGCSDVCLIEVGWTCDEFVPGAQANTIKSVCTQAAIVTTPVTVDPMDNSRVLITEGGTGSYEISLSTYVLPGAEVRVTVTMPLNTINDGSKALTATGSDLVFLFTNATDKAYTVKHPFGLRAADSLERDFNRTYDVIHGISSTDKNFNLAAVKTQKVRVADDDVAGIAVSKTQLMVEENGRRDTYKLKLTSKPFGQIFVDVHVDTVNQVLVTPPRIAFTASNWDQEQTIYVEALDNLNIDGLVQVGISHTVSDIGGLDLGYRNLTLGYANVTVNVTDNDTPGIEIVPNTLEVEEAQNVTYTVNLQTAPIQSVNITLTPDDGTLTAIGPTGTNVLYINPYNYLSAQTVTVTAVDNNIIQATATKKITHTIVTADTNYQTLLNAADYPYVVSVTITDDDVAGLIHVTSVALVEGNPAYELVVRMRTMPSAPVVVKLALTDPSYIFIGGSDVVFVDGVPSYFKWEPSEWQQERKVLLRALEDDNVDNGPRSTELSLTTESQDPNYVNVVKRAITVSLEDNDVAKVTIDPTAGIVVKEGGIAESIYVKLETAPRATVVVTLEPDSQLTVDPPALYFTASNYSTAARLKVLGKEDSFVEDKEHTGILTPEVSSADAIYDAIVLPPIRVTVKDNDVETQRVDVNKWGAVISPTIPMAGAVLNIPAGVLEEETTISVSEVTAPLPVGMAGPERDVEDFACRRVSGIYMFKPHDFEFQRAVTISLEFDQDAATAAGGNLLLVRSEKREDGPWKIVDEVDFSAGIASVATTHFSLYYVAASQQVYQAPAPPVIGDPCDGCCPSGMSDLEIAMTTVACALFVVLVSALFAVVSLKRKLQRVTFEALEAATMGGMDEHPADGASKQLAIEGPAPRREEPVALPGPYNGDVPRLEGSTSAV